jgi:hypothetical protein
VHHFYVYDLKFDCGIQAGVLLGKYMFKFSALSSLPVAVTMSTRNLVYEKLYMKSCI